MSEKWLEHHSAYYNADKIVSNLILLQDHYAIDPCRECIGKHIQTIIAYAEEGLMLDDALQLHEFLTAAEELAQRHKQIVLECAVKEDGHCDIKGPADMQKMIEELRAMRRELNMAIYGFAGDLLYDSDGEGEHEHSHTHDFIHEHE